MPDGEIIYPQKVNSLKTYPGKNRIQLEWVIVDPKVTSCQVFYEQAGVQGSTTVPVRANGDFSNDTIRVTIPNLEETTYKFKIISHDDFGHTSISVETEEQAYGSMYERSLLNRSLKSAAIDENEHLQIEWFDADDNETGVNIMYTDIDGNSRTMKVEPSETATSITDLKSGTPVFYNAMYKPVPSAIDTFYAQIANIPYFANITADVLKNTAMPFTNTGIQVVAGAYNVTDWIINAAAAGNGTSMEARGYVLSLWAWSGSSPSPTLDNGKVYQTIELEAGAYRFDATIYETRQNNNGYLVVALGNDLPDTNDVPQNSLGYVRVPDGIAVGARPTISAEFTVSAKSTVSLGIVATFPSNAMMHFTKVELWKQQ